MDHNLEEENIVIRNENGGIIESIPLPSIRWDPEFQSGVSTFRSVQYGSFGVTPKYEFVLKRLREDVTLDDCNAEYWKQLKNANIVKLFLHGRFTGKTLQVNNELILITEFCNVGSLSDLIRKRFPGGLDAHYYGLLLRCILNSLGYLGAQNPPLLNRHIMPSKILLHKQPNGQEIFKLNGFANIRKCPLPSDIWKKEDYVAGNWKFMEYCHPRVLKKYMDCDDEVTNSDKKYLDLYSAGALLYKAATGQHPIRPSKCNSIQEMQEKLLEAYKLKENHPEIFSLYQQEDGEIWHREDDFPGELLLSSVSGLLPELKKLIANLFQVNQTKIMPFNDFIDECDRILRKYWPN